MKELFLTAIMKPPEVILNIFSVSVPVSFFLFLCSKGQVVGAYLDTSIQMTLTQNRNLLWAKLRLEFLKNFAVIYPTDKIPTRLNVERLKRRNRYICNSTFFGAIIVNFSGQNIVRGTDGSGILEDCRENSETFREPAGFFPRNSWISTRIPNNLQKNDLFWH